MKKIAVLLTIVLFLGGCITPAGEPGLCTVHAQAAKYTLNTAQKCVKPDLARKISDLAMLLSLQAFEEFGAPGFKSYTDAVREVQKNGTPMVCIVPEPESCCMAGSCASPYNKDKTLAARKVGCASGWHAWASESWPFLCKETWPDEPHCVQDKSLIMHTGVEEWLRHEVFNMAVQRWSSVYTPDYQHKLYQEIEQIVKIRFEAALSK